jgi:hypothetical protein
MTRPDDNRLHFSSLKYIATTPKEFDYQRTAKRKDTKAFKLGRAVHAKWLLNITPDIYTERRDLRVKEYQEYLQQLESRDGIPPDPENILNDAEYTLVMNTVRALDLHQEASRIKSRCNEFEKPLKWTRSGIECAGTLDMCGPGVLAELKTCEPRRIHPLAFQKQARWYRYPEQIAWYAVGNGTPTDVSCGVEWPDSYIISVESSGAHDVVVHRCGELLLDQANSTVDEWLRTYSACKAAGRWPGHDDDIVEFDAEIEFGPGDGDD